MKRATKLTNKPALVLVDGIYKPDLNIPVKTIIEDSIEDAMVRLQQLLKYTEITL